MTVIFELDLDRDEDSIVTLGRHDTESDHIKLKKKDAFRVKDLLQVFPEPFGPVAPDTEEYPFVRSANETAKPDANNPNKKVTETPDLKQDPKFKGRHYMLVWEATVTERPGPHFKVFP